MDTKDGQSKLETKLLEMTRNKHSAAALHFLVFLTYP